MREREGGGRERGGRQTDEDKASLLHSRLVWLPFVSVSTVRLLVDMVSEKNLPELMQRP